MTKMVLGMVLALATFAEASLHAAPMTDVLKVRFDRSFAAAQTWLPAGEYSIRQIDSRSDLPVLLIESAYGAVMVPVNRVADFAIPSRTEAVLEVDNNKYYLKRIRIAGQNYSYEIIGSPAPRPE